MKKLLAFVIGLLVFGHVYNMYAGSYDEASDIKKRAEARANENYETAIFAGGCFWCMQPPFDKLPGVITTIAGYSGGPEENPTYKQVSYGKTGHAESVEIIYDPKKITYDELLDVYWRNIDPTDSEGQFADRGKQYRPAIFYLNEGQKKAAMDSREALHKSGRFDEPVVVEITEAGPFWDAEEYHQMFYKKDKATYYGYRKGSGRDRFIQKHWGGESAKSH